MKLVNENYNQEKDKYLAKLEVTQVDATKTQEQLTAVLLENKKLNDLIESQIKDAIIAQTEL